MKARKLLSITGAVVITLTGGAAAATGNLMAPQPKQPPVDKVADAGTAGETPVPLNKKEAKKDPAKKDASKQ
jgi:hypothetical protein